MPRCDGRPNVACPAKANNSSVKPSQGELMLCKECEVFRFPYMAKPVSKPTSATEAQSLPPVTSTGAVERMSSTTSSTPVQDSDGFVRVNSKSSKNARKTNSDRSALVNHAQFIVLPKQQQTGVTGCSVQLYSARRPVGQCFSV